MCLGGVCMFLHILVVAISIVYGGALFYLDSVIPKEGNRSIRNFVEVILAFACITSIDFMSHAFEINRGIEVLCYLLMLLIVLVFPAVVKRFK